MFCECGGKFAVIDTVYNTEDNEIYRKRKCSKCGYVVYTMEMEVDYGETFSKEWNKHHRKWKGDIDGR